MKDGTAGADEGTLRLSHSPQRPVRDSARHDTVVLSAYAIVFVEYSRDARRGMPKSLKP
jgi:hypothetical protein